MKQFLLIMILSLGLTACVNPEAEKTKLNVNNNFEENIDKTVPMPNGEDVVRLFFSLINEKRLNEALDMMSGDNLDTENEKQAWAVQFNSFDSIQVNSIEKIDEENWTENFQVYKVSIETKMNDSFADEVIPYFGWNKNGINTRWVIIKKDKENNPWKIIEIATGY